MLGLVVVLTSAWLSVYWFRHKCRAITHTSRSKKYARAIAKANGLTFLESRKRLQTGSTSTLDQIYDQMYDALRKDYWLISSLLSHTPGIGRVRSSLLNVFMRTEFAVLRWVYPVARRVSSGRLARKALMEMTSVLAYLAHRMGERSAPIHGA